MLSPVHDLLVFFCIKLKKNYNNKNNNNKNQNVMPGRSCHQSSLQCSSHITSPHSAEYHYPAHQALFSMKDMSLRYAFWEINSPVRYSSWHPPSTERESHCKKEKTEIQKTRINWTYPFIIRSLVVTLYRATLPTAIFENAMAA